MRLVRRSPIGFRKGSTATAFVAHGNQAHRSGRINGGGLAGPECYEVSAGRRHTEMRLPPRAEHQRQAGTHLDAILHICFAGRNVLVVVLGELRAQPQDHVGDAIA